MTARGIVDVKEESVVPLRAKLLGHFLITLGDTSGGPWRRPTGKRLCELVLVSPGRRVSRGAGVCSAVSRHEPDAIHQCALEGTFDGPRRPCTSW